MAISIVITFDPSTRKDLPCDWMEVRIRSLEALKDTIGELGGLSPDCNNATSFGRPYRVTVECLHRHHPHFNKIEPVLRRKIEELFGVKDFTMKEC